MKRGALVERQLGFRPECSCKHLAVVAYQAHPVDACGGRRAPADVVLMCGQCLHNELERVGKLLLDAFLGSRPDECQQCGLRIVSLSDIIDRIQPLWIWPEEH